MLKKIEYCPTCDCDSLGGTFCSNCGTKMLSRDPEVHVDVEVEGQGSRCMTLTELFDIAKRQGIIR